MTDKLDTRTLHQLKLMMAKLQNDPTTMAWIIGSYQKQEGLSWDTITDVLRTTEEILLRLALCKRPDPNSSDFRQQVLQLAQFANIDLVLLTNMIRQVDSVTVFSRITTANNVTGQTSLQPGFSAARDKSGDKNETGDENDVANE